MSSMWKLTPALCIPMLMVPRTTTPRTRTIVTVPGIILLELAHNFFLHSAQSAPADFKAHNELAPPCLTGLLYQCQPTRWYWHLLISLVYCINASLPGGTGTSLSHWSTVSMPAYQVVLLCNVPSPHHSTVGTQPSATVAPQLRNSLLLHVTIGLSGLSSQSWRHFYFNKLMWSTLCGRGWWNIISVCIIIVIMIILLLYWRTLTHPTILAWSLRPRPLWVTHCIHQTNVTKWLPSRRRLCSLITRTSRFKNTFVPLSVVHLNAMNWCLGLINSIILFLWCYYYFIIITSVCHLQLPHPHYWAIRTLSSDLILLLLLLLGVLVITIIIISSSIRHVLHHTSLLHKSVFQVLFLFCFKACTAYTPP